MRSIVKSEDRGVSEIIGYVLIFSMVTVMLSTVILVYVPYSSNTNLSNYESQALSSLTALQNQMHQLGTANGTQYSQVIPMGVKGTFFSQNTPTTLGFNSFSSASLSYSLGLNIQVEGHQSKVVTPYNRVIGSIPVGINPDGIVYDPDNGYLFVINYESKDVSVINPAANETVVATIGLAMYPVAITYDSSNQELFLCLSNGLGTDSEVVSVSTSSNNFGYISTMLNTTSFNFYDVAYDQASGALLLTFFNNTNNTGTGRNSGQSGIAVYDATTFLALRSPISPWGSNIIPSSLTYDPSNGLIYVALGSNVSAINGVTYDIVQYYGTGIPSPWAVAFDNSTGNIYVTASYASSGSGTNSPITPVYHSGGFGQNSYPTSTNQTTIYDGINTKEVGYLYAYGTPQNALPTSILYNPGNRYIYVTDFGTHCVAIYDGQNTSRHNPIQVLQVGNGPGAGFSGMAYDPANGNVYVANLNSDNVSVIEGNTNVSSGWNVQGSKLGLSSQVNGNGSIYLSSSNTFSTGNLLLLQDGSVLERTHGTVTNQTTLPFVFNIATALTGLSTTLVDLNGPGNTSTSSASSVTVGLHSLVYESFAISSGQLVTLVNGSQILYSKVLRVNLLSFSYSFRSSNYAMWDEVFYHTYNNATTPVSQISSLTSWDFKTLPIMVTVNSTSQTITFQKIPGSIIAMTSFFINYFSYSVQFSS